MATQSRARMFHATAKALRSAEDRRFDGALDPTLLISDLEPVDTEPMEVSVLGIDTSAVDAERLSTLKSEHRWAESKLMQASERLAEAQEAGRKDLVALERMRLDLKQSFATERAYLKAQYRMFSDVLPGLIAQERELAGLVDGGATTASVIRELAAVRAERKLTELAMGQVDSQLAVIDENEAALDFATYNERYDRSPDGASMHALARMRSAQQRTRRLSIAARDGLTRLMNELGLDRTYGEIAAIASFITSEAEGDSRAKTRVDRVRGAQVRRELAQLPTPASELRAGIAHPISWIKARRRS